jgi:hypothetical protein
MDMVRATEIFTPTDVPTITYVERTTKDYEEELRRAFSIPKMIISISGPSKSGKTVLVTKFVAPENLIHIYGASIKKVDDLWQSVITWMGGPIQKTRSQETKTTFEVSGTAGGSAGIPLIAKGKAELSAGAALDRSTTKAEVFAPVGVDDIAQEIGDSDYVIFLDDFHYIQKDVREEIGRQIKAAAEKGIRICTASVPHRSDDVVRSNTELRGRVTAIDMTYWSDDELEKIAQKGFQNLGVAAAPAILSKLAREAFGSPQLMQAICLNFCFEKGIFKSDENERTIIEDEVNFVQILERASVISDFSTMINTLHAGPKLRGTERKIYKFIDGTSGDVYRCVLLAIRQDPAALSFRYDEMLKRTKEVCFDESPVGSSVSESLLQMAKLAKTIQEEPAIEWDEDVLDIVEPYFLFYLRCSSHLTRLAGA